MRELKYLVFTSLLWGCQQQNQDLQKIKGGHGKDKGIAPLIEKVLSLEEQSKLTPDSVIKILKAGNERFRSNDLTARDHSKQTREAVLGQFPKAIVLTCIDSRIPVEDIFDRGIGDIFVARVGGNVVNKDILGSMEFACRISGAKLVLVLGHEHCEAIISAIDGLDLGNITSIVSKIQPSITKVTGYKGKASSVNPEFVELVAKNNIQKTVQDIRMKSPILKTMELKGEIKILGAYYDLDNGEVFFKK